MKTTQKKLLEALRATEPLTFPEVADRAGCSPRNLRYALDHDLAGSSVFGRGDSPRRGRGVPRELKLYPAFMLALPALMLEAGLRGALVRKAMARLLDWGRDMAKGNARAGPAHVFFAASTGGAVVEIGDGRAVRVVLATQPDPRLRSFRPKPLSWRDLQTGHAVGDAYVCVISIRIDLRQLVRRLT